MARRGKLALAVGIPVVSTFLTIACATLDRMMPLTGNILVDFGLGHRTLMGIVPGAPKVLWMALTWASAAGVGVVAACLWSCASSTQAARVGGIARWELVLFGSLAAPHVIPPWVTYMAFFDRYVMAIAPFAFVLCLTLAARSPRSTSWMPIACSGLVLALFCWFAVAGTHDYLTWSRARWRAGTELLAQGHSVEEIEGGFEFNYFFENQSKFEERTVGLAVTRADATYGLSFSEVPGWSFERQVPLETWLPWSVPCILVLKKQDR
jgi:hypothetical protein